MERNRRNWSSGLVQTATSSFDYIYYMLTMDVVDSECIHAPKCVAATVADRTSSVPNVSETHGFATYRPRLERLREPRVRVWQVLSRRRLTGLNLRAPSGPKAVDRVAEETGNQPIDCSVSIAVFKHLEKSRYPSDNMEALFLRWRDTIEKAISDKFDADGAPDVASVHLFLKDVNRR
jgi:hypothetical protein